MGNRGSLPLVVVEQSIIDSTKRMPCRFDLGMNSINSQLRFLGLLFKVSESFCSVKSCMVLIKRVAADKITYSLIELAGHTMLGRLRSVTSALTTTGGRESRSLIQLDSTRSVAI